MSSLLRAVVLLMVVCDPLGAFAIAGGLCEGAGSATLRRLAAVASGTAFAVLAAAALASDAAAGFLDLSSGSVTLAAAVVLVVPGAWLLVRGDRMALVAGSSGGATRGALVPIAFPVMAGPGAVLVMVSLTLTRGAGTAVAAAAVVALVTAAVIATGSTSAALRYPVLLNRVGARVVGAAVLGVALALAVEGVLGY